MLFPESANTRFDPVSANDEGHQLHTWVDADGVFWACAAYDHGPMCRLCRRVTDETEFSLLSNVASGWAHVWTLPDGTMRYRLTEEGEAHVRQLLETDPEAQAFYDQLVTSDMERGLSDGG